MKDKDKNPTISEIYSNILFLIKELKAMLCDNDPLNHYPLSVSTDMGAPLMFFHYKDLDVIDVASYTTKKNSYFNLGVALSCKRVDLSYLLSSYLMRLLEAIEEETPAISEIRSMVLLMKSVAPISYEFSKKKIQKSSVYKGEEDHKYSLSRKYVISGLNREFFRKRGVKNSLNVICHTQAVNVLNITLKSIENEWFSAYVNQKENTEKYAFKLVISAHLSLIETTLCELLKTARELNQ
ncbi:hypothetical protein [Photobacterium kishitanii]|uniref:Uncharacterized protein n=1 Tax=Photobacterium kishitanii TaxID=318456 RepID=A0A2T3KLW6_9GAMM|nr:hypothetical protein [Photobacterium kishitanii]PSV00647.1 hypothetical protein C9J27_05780 [Photobacterium kishitanii]